MQIQGQVGPQVQADGSAPNIRQDKQGGVIVADGHGRYYEAVSRGKVFSAATSSAITALATSAATGFILYNPVNSGVNLSLLEVILAQTSVATTAACFVGLSYAATATLPTSTTGGPGRSAVLGNTAPSIGQAYSAATLGTANVFVRPIWSPSVSATATTGIPPVVKDEVAGALAIAPGFFVALYASSALSAAISMTWEEVPI